MKNLLRLFIFISVLPSCQLLGETEPDVLARVGDHYLYITDLSHIKFSENKDDSLAEAKSFIDAWVNKQLLLEKALQNLSEEQADFSEQLENYKNSLLIYAYENQLIKQKLDTLVSEKELKEYYLTNKDNFKLKEQLIQLRFVKYLNNAPIQDSLKYWLYSSENYQDKLTNYCTQFAVQCHLDTITWVSTSTLRKIMPEVDNDSQLSKLSGNKLVLSDSTHSFMAYIFDINDPGTPAPISFVKDQIIQIIINKRKLQLLNKVKKEIFEEATLKKSYEIYE